MFKGLSLLAVHEMGGAVRRRAMAAVFYGAAGVIGLIAVGFALRALHEWLLTVMTSLQANLCISGGLALVAMILAAIGFSKRNAKSETSPATTAAMVAAPLVLRNIGRLNIGTIVTLGVLVAGAVVGRQIAKS